jgi:hypothetical protein
MRRRSFFKGLFAVVAAVALAPEIAFGAGIKEEVQARVFWYQETRTSFCYTKEYMEALTLIVEDPKRNYIIENFSGPLCGAPS